MAAVIVWLFVASSTYNAYQPYSPYFDDKASCEVVREAMKKQGEKPSECMRVTIRTRQ
jgi:hypothetical protein